MTSISRKKTARTAGLWYLLLGITGIFGLMYIPSQIMVEGNAAATANNIIQSELLYRYGILGNLICQTLFIFLVLKLYRLFKDVDENNAKLMVTFVVVSIPITFVSELIHIAPLILLSGNDFLQSFNQEQLQSLSMFCIELYYHGINIVEIFWGLWLFPFGVLVYKSGFIPKVFGILLMIACFGYLAHTFAALIYPDIRGLVSEFTSITGTVGEFAIILWLLIKGTRDSAQVELKTA